MLMSMQDTPASAGSAARLSYMGRQPAIMETDAMCTIEHLAAAVGPRGGGRGMIGVGTHRDTLQSPKRLYEKMSGKAPTDYTKPKKDYTKT